MNLSEPAVGNNNAIATVMNAGYYHLDSWHPVRGTMIAVRDSIGDEDTPVRTNTWCGVFRKEDKYYAALAHGYGQWIVLIPFDALDRAHAEIMDIAQRLNLEV